MIILAIICAILTVVICDITCASSTTYVKFVKTNGMYDSYEETFEIYDGTTKLYTSPTFANNEVRTIEHCLVSSVNNQYNVVMSDGYGDSWYSGSYLTIYGLYGNVVFKSMLTNSLTETHSFSLYYGIPESDQWKMISGNDSTGWTDYTFSDSSWNPVTLGSVTTAVSGTQYFRKQFTGLSSMAAYDVRLYYKAGVVAYINGNEVYRDNMGDGEITSTSTATGEHTELAYRGFIRPGSEVSSSQSILAVEIHFVTAQTTVDFNAYLAILAPSALDTTCFIYGETVTISASPMSGSPLNAFDFSRTTAFQYSSALLPVTLTYSFGGPKPYINAVRIWPYTNVLGAPGTFTFQGSNDGNTWTNIVDVVGATYTSSTYKEYYGYFQSSLFNNYRAVISGAASTTDVSVYEMQPLICSSSIPTSITFTPNTFTFYVHYEEVSISPDIDEFSSCSASGLPAGLSIDSTTCVISGIGTSAVSGVTVTVTSVLAGSTYSGTFTITLQECAGTYINVLRTYEYNAFSEAFDIKDAVTQAVVMSVALNSGQVSNEEWTNVACVTGTKYIATTSSSLPYWQANSYLYIRAVLSGNQMETILRLKYDSYVNFPNTRTFNAAYTVKAHSQWYYKHAEVPANWYSSTSTEGWTQGTDSTFPSSSNQIQLYKATFSVSDVNNVAGVVLSIKYKYGIVVYMNGNEAFRNGLTGSVSTSSYGSNAYSDVMYRQISLPLKTVQIGDTASVNYIQQGSNTIAVALVALNAQQTEVNFDCAIRLMGEASESRIFDYISSYNAISGFPNYLMNHHYLYYIYYYACVDNYFNIAFNDDRREWIDALTVKLYYTQNTQHPHQFTLKARNSGEDWTTLSTVTGLTWSQTGQAHTIYFRNNKAYNEYRFENFATGDSTDCNWRLGTLDLKSVMTTMAIPELSYSSSISIFKDIEMGEEYPNSEYYYGFTITPALPEGITLDPNTGIISGTAMAESTVQQYSVTANKLTGGTSTATFSFVVEICTGGRSLVTLVARTDYYPQQSSYKLYQGIGTSGTVIDQIDQFMTSSSLNYGDFCLNDGIYTLQLLDSLSDGWTNPAGYYLTVDLGEMIFEMGQVPSGVSSVSTMFSTYFPFQINYSDWKVNMVYAENWNNVEYDDSTWITAKANEIGTNANITTFIRHDVNIPNIDNYHVLNVRVRYAGGIAVYFNRRLVARFNLDEEYDLETESTGVHDANTFSRFHIIMSTVGAVTGKNVIAFEIHKPSGQSSSSSVVFDATGVFGVNDCSIVVDSYSSIDGSTVYQCDSDELFDLNPTTYGYQENAQGSYLEWTVENLEGTKFNNFAMHTIYERTSYGFSLYVRSNTQDEYIAAVEVLNQNLLDRGRNAWSSPVGIAGFRQMRFEVDDTANSIVYVSSYILQYCKPSGSGVCPADGDYPSVGDGEISPSTCEYGYRGYSYRTCQNGILGDIQTDRCIQKVPARLHYDSSLFNLILDVSIHIASPSYNNIIEEFSLGGIIPLPQGLTLNSETGEITGIPTEEISMSIYTIYGANTQGVTFTTISISVRKGSCKAEGVFPTTTVGEEAAYDCAMGGSYVGTQKRACVLGSADGEWQNVTGMCVSISLIIVVVIVVVITIVIVICIVVYVNKKAKTANGVKGKASAKKSLSKTSNEKSVNV